MNRACFNLDSEMLTDPKTARIGWIGTGIMGRWMCHHLMERGGFKNVTVYNRTPSKAQPLVDMGAKLAASAAEVAESSDIIFTIVGYPRDVEDLALNQLMPRMRPGGVLVDMTTSQPSLAKRIASEFASRQLHAIDAPVSGGDVGAREARLSIMVCIQCHDNVINTRTGWWRG